MKKIKFDIFVRETNDLKELDRTALKSFVIFHLLLIVVNI